jgi:hypothetical protein
MIVHILPFVTFAQAWQGLLTMQHATLQGIHHFALWPVKVEGRHFVCHQTLLQSYAPYFYDCH